VITLLLLLPSLLVLLLEPVAMQTSWPSGVQWQKVRLRSSPVCWLPRMLLRAVQVVTELVHYVSYLHSNTMLTGAVAAPASSLMAGT
jgi:hypothetical protein